MAQVMIAKATGMVPTEGRGRMMVRKGVTTASADSDIVRNSPHLWKPIKVDYPGPGGEQPPGGDLVDEVATEMGAAYLDQLRRLCASMEDAGVEILGGGTDTEPDTLPARVVDTALDLMGIADAGVPARPEPEPESEPDADDDAPVVELPADSEGDEDGPAAGIPVNTGVGTGGETPLDEDRARAAADAGREGSAVNVGLGGPAGPQPPEAEDIAADEDSPDSTPEGRAAIRTWAAENGVEVSERGKIPHDVVERYRDAMGGHTVNRGV